MLLKIRERTNSYSELKDLCWTVVQAEEMDSKESVVFLAIGRDAQAIDDLADGAVIRIESDSTVSLANAPAEIVLLANRIILATA